MIDRMCFDRFESLETPATVSPLVIILPSTTLYCNQLVITNRHARHTFLNARILKLSKPDDHVCSGIFSGVPSLDNSTAIDRAGMPKYTEP